MVLFAFAVVGLLVTTFHHFGGNRLVSHLRLRPTTHGKGQEILLVSAFFPLSKSKHPMSDYETWLSNFLSHVTTDVYLFCPPDVAPLIIRLRGGLPLTLNTTFSSPFEVPPMRGLETRYKEMHRWDREKDRHGPELYAVWNAKAYFLDEGMRNIAARRGRPHDYVFWNDAGSMRDWQYRAWPDPAWIAKLFILGEIETGSRKDDIIFIPMWNPPGPEFETWKEETGPLDPAESFSEGSFFGGRPRAVTRYRQLFFMYHYMWLARSEFVGKDENMINGMLLLYPEHFFSVWLYDRAAPAVKGISPDAATPLGECGSSWWYYQWWLAGTEDRGVAAETWLRRSPRGQTAGAEEQRCRMTRMVTLEWVLSRAFPRPRGQRWSHPRPSIEW